MKDIRQGNDITVKWTVTAGSPIDLEEVELSLFDQYGDKAIINDVEVTVTGENVYRYQFKFYGKDQKRLGIYRVLLQRNVDEIGMVTLDKTNAFRLFGVCDFGIVRGEDEDHVETVVVELESTISTSVEGEGFDPELYYTKEETNELLAERQRAFMSQDPLEMANNRLRLRMLAVGNDVRGFVGTQVYPQVTEESGADAIMPSIKAINDHIVTPLQTAIGGKQDTIQDLSDIRSGAAAGATAYQKPASGIPATDLAQAVRDDLNMVALTIVPVEVGETSLAAQVGNYYLFGGEVGTMVITLPTLLSQTKVKGCVLSITTGASPNINITAAAGISWFDGWEGFAASTSYEINAIYNGQRWVLSHSVVANS